MARQPAKNREAGATGGTERPSDMFIMDVHREFRGKWVLLRPTKLGKYERVLRGVVIVSGSHSKVLKKLVHLIETEPRPEHPYDLFKAGAYLPLSWDAVRDGVDGATETADRA